MKKVDIHSPEEVHEGEPMNEAEMVEATKFLNGYLDLALEIYENIRHDPERYAAFHRMLREQGVKPKESPKDQKSDSPWIIPL